MGSSLAFAAPLLPCGSFVEYRALLLHVGEEAKSPAVDIDQLIASVPLTCRFDADSKHFQVSNSQLQTELLKVKTADTKDRADDLRELQESLELRLKSLDGYAVGVDSTAKPKLQHIFEQREFRSVGSQDAKAMIREEILKLLLALFSLIAANTQQALLFAEIFMWTVIGLAVLFILWKLYGWLTRERPLERTREIIPFAPSSKSWQHWMKEARAALAIGDLREAVHSSYWAAISHLESSGAWIPDRARTPREYLRLISKSDSARPLLVDISRVFEVVWYGNRAPSQTDCEAFLAKVEQIACR